MTVRGWPGRICGFLIWMDTSKILISGFLVTHWQVKAVPESLAVVEATVAASEPHRSRVMHPELHADSIVMVLCNRIVIIKYLFPSGRSRLPSFF